MRSAGTVGCESCSNNDGRPSSAVGCVTVERQRRAAADAYVFITPEYNYSPPPSLVNALDFVYREWNDKPCGFVGYGGVSGGLRAVQMERLHVTTLKMMPVMEGVTVPSVPDHISESGEFASNERLDGSAQTMLDELVRWAEALQPMWA